MSGGSYNYIYCQLSEECENRMHDAEMNELIKDLCSVLRALEWWQSSDTTEESYRKELKKFKTKWFNAKREERLKKYIDEQVGIVKMELYKLICVNEEEKNDNE